MLDPATIRTAIPHALKEAHFTELPNYYKGKVRDCYDLPDGKRILISTDRQSAFDRKDFPAIPFKGQVLTQTARFWFEATKDLCANHVVEYPDPNVIVGKTLKMLPVEVVVRDYMTGSTDTSIWPMYERGERKLYGYDFPEGLKKNAKLPETIITPTTKGERDEPLACTDVPAHTGVDAAIWEEVQQKALAIFARGREIAAQHGLILVDTKYEFGLDENGVVTLADEIHTPDSSRYWLKNSYASRHAEGLEPESLDKEFLRLWVRANHPNPYDLTIPMNVPDDVVVEFSTKYIRLFETVTGLPFDAPAANEPVAERIKRNLAKYF